MAECAHVAQSAEHVLGKDGVVPMLAGVAQSVEHVLGKDGVTGSIPVSSSHEAQTYGTRVNASLVAECAQALIVRASSCEQFGCWCRSTRTRASGTVRTISAGSIRPALISTV